VALTGQKI